jgi:hypothetical protein
MGVIQAQAFPTFAGQPPPNIGHLDDAVSAWRQKNNNTVTLDLNTICIVPGQFESWTTEFPSFPKPLNIRAFGFDAVSFLARWLRFGFGVHLAQDAV